MSAMRKKAAASDSKKTEDALWKEAYRPVLGPLRDVKGRLQTRESLEALAQFMAAFPGKRVIEQAKRYILESGGKRIRAALCLLSTRASGAPAKRAIPLAAGVELFHAATLVIDDLIEDADIRRGQPAVHRMWGDSGALAAAIGLQLRALPSFIESMRNAPPGPHGPSKMMAGLGQTVARIFWGEVMQHRSKMQYDLDEETYLRIISDKTASLFELCCMGGALVAGADERAQKAMKIFGTHLGLAFQITDDILDLEGELSRLGKTPGSDLAEGRVTLPIIYFFRDANKRQRRLMAKMLPPLRKPPLPREDIVAELTRAGSITQCRKAARAEASRAKKALSKIPDSTARDSLRTLATLAAARSR